MMKKLMYEKPKIIIEEFLSTQCVAANCGNDLVLDPISIPLKDDNGDWVTGKTYCKCGNNGHQFDPKKLVDYDTNENDIVVLFASSNGCELMYDTLSDSPDDNADLVALGQLITRNGNKSWNSDEHRLIIEGVKVPSA